MLKALQSVINLKEIQKTTIADRRAACFCTPYLSVKLSIVFPIELTADEERARCLFIGSLHREATQTFVQ